MAKRRGGRAMPGGGGDMMKQLAAMQERMVAEQESLREHTVEVSVGGGAVKVEMNGHQKLVGVVIDPQLLNAEEAEMLNDLLIAAVNQAVDKTQSMAQERMGRITSGLNLPPGLGI